MRENSLSSNRTTSTPLTELLDRLFREFEGWCVAWGLSRLSREASISFSQELGLALGRCDLRERRILLNSVLLQPENQALLFETLCHEAAHLIAYLRYGPAIAEHGPEWREYMVKAGFKPRATIRAKRVAGLAAPEKNPPHTSRGK